MFKGLRSNMKKGLTAALLLAVLVIAAVGVTVAYIHYDSASVNNDFTSAKVNATIEETFNNEAKTSISVRNNSDFDVYIRVAVIANTVNEEGKITGDASEVLDAETLPATGWVKIGYYYYYTSPVKKDDATGSLIKKSIDLTGIQVTVLSDAIQAAPAKAVTEAWGVTVGTDGNISAN